MTTIIEEEYDREAQAIEDAYASGDITEQKRNADLRELERDFLAADDRNDWGRFR